MKKIFVSLLIIAAAGTITNTHAQSATGFHVLKTFHIASEGGWDYIAVGPGNNRLYVSHGGQVNILDQTTGDSVGVIENTTGVHGIAFIKEAGKGYTSNGRLNNVTVFDLKTNVVLGQVATGENPDAIMYESFSKKIITCNGRSKNLSIIDPVENKLVATVDVGGKPETAVSDDAGKIYVNVEDKNEIVQVNAKTFTVENHWPLAPGTSPTGLAIDTKTKRLFAGCGDSKLLVVMDANNGKIIDKLPIGDGCDGVAFDNNTKNIFSSNGEGTVTVIHENSADNFKMVETATTKRRARTIAIDEQKHLIYLPTAEFEKPAPGSDPKARTKMIAGTFQVLVVGK
jgi:DNA-binding beta-propeller fold protein YncE